MSNLKEKIREIVYPVKRVKGGAGVKHHKNTADFVTERIKTPQTVTILMNQHIGAPAQIKVKKGDKVLKGDLIGDNDAFVFSPIYSSVSGEVTDIIDVLLPNGTTSKGVVITSDGEMKEREFTPPKVETVDDLIKATKESGLVGLGGAGFPTHVKFATDKKIDTIVINGAECEPYITADYREIMENSWDVMSGVYTLLDILKPEKIIIAIEENKPKALEELLKISSNEDADPDNKVRVMKLKTRYPQGAEKVLILAATGKKIPTGKLPADVGCLVMNITSISFLGRYLKTGRPLMSRRLTVDGSAISNPKNVRVPIGTSIKDIVDFCGGYKELPGKIILGGPMMGNAIADDSLPISKSNNAILAFLPEDVERREESDCIKCGKCVDACPMNLVPTRFQNLVKKGDFDTLQKAGIMTCMECGSCAYACPAKRDIVQYIRLGKTEIRKAGKK
jgi:electron transport complex protein RnfC